MPFHSAHGVFSIGETFFAPTRLAEARLPPIS
jgi:hypothetical protein